MTLRNAGFQGLDQDCVATSQPAGLSTVADALIVVLHVNHLRGRYRVRSKVAKEDVGRLRQEIQRNPCPTCGAAPGDPCVGAKGANRISNHKARNPRNSSAAYRANFIESCLENQDTEGVSGFVVYAILDSEKMQYIYVGQTGNFPKRVSAHLRKALKPVRNPPIRKWLYEAIASGRNPIFTVLERCPSELLSLETESFWVGKLASAGHPLLNNWRTHKSIIKNETGTY